MYTAVSVIFLKKAKDLEKAIIPDETNSP